MSTRYIEGLLRAVTSSKSKLDLQSVLSTLTSATAAASGPLDHLYARIGALNGPFFPSGWGNLSIVNYEEDLRHLIQGPQSSIKVSWHLVERGNRDGTDYVLYEGVFRTPCLQRVYDALPLESRTGRVQLLMPAHLQTFHPQPLDAEPPAQAPSAGQHSSADREGHMALRGPHAMAAAAAGRSVAAADGPACVIHLAATGDQTFGRRLRLGFPLLKDNVCSMVLESPFYGARRPAAQRGSKLLRVSDLLILGWATIAESVNLLHWLREEGYGSLGLCGLSMGGVHASMAAGLYPGDVAVAPLLAPRSAAVAYCDGAMRAAMAWEPLLQEVDENNNHITHVVLAAGRAITVQVPVTHGSEPSTGAIVKSVAYMREATYALADLELRGEKEHLATGSTTASAAGTAAAVGGLRADHPASTSAGASAVRVVDGGERPRTDEVGQGGGRQTRTAGSGAPRVAASSNAAASVVEMLRGVSVMDLYGKLAGAALRTAGGMGGGGGGTEHAAATAPLCHGAAAVTNAVSSGPSSTADTHSSAHTNPWLGRLQHAPPSPAVSSSPQSIQAAAEPQNATPTAPTDRLGSGAAKAAITTTNSTTSTTNTTAAVDSGQMPARRLLGEMARAFQHLRAGDRQLDNPATVMRLKRVLETYTDITRYPRPRRTDAAVIVAARDDAYVDPESVRQLHRYWSGSELRMVSGGHVSAFLMHQEAFRGAIRDSLVRVRLPPPPPPSPTSP